MATPATQQGMPLEPGKSIVAKDHSNHEDVVFLGVRPNRWRREGDFDRDHGELPPTGSDSCSTF